MTKKTEIESELAKHERELAQQVADDINAELEAREWHGPRLAKESGLPAMAVHRAVNPNVKPPQLHTLGRIYSTLGLSLDAVIAKVFGSNGSGRKKANKRRVSR